MNELRAYGPENQGWGRRYAIGDGAVGTMASDLFPVVNSGFADMDPELLALQGARMRAQARSGANAVAARFSAVGIANPLASGVIGVLEVLRAVPGAASTLSLRVQGVAVSALQGSVLGFPLDSRLRFAGTRASIRLLLTDEVAASNYGAQIDAFTYAAATEQTIDLPYILAPGETLWVVNETANQNVNVSARWRQRRIEEGEVSPV